MIFFFLAMLGFHCFLVLSSSSKYPTGAQTTSGWAGYRVSFETSFNSKQPKLEPKLVSALSETKRLFQLFRFYGETASFGVSVKPKLNETKPKQAENCG
jgi:hypothetical protein